MHLRKKRGKIEVLKPGGYLLAFGGSRTYHRIACAIEDADFEKFPIIGDIWYLLIEETTHQPICLFTSNHVTECNLVSELETDSESEK